MKEEKEERIEQGNEKEERWKGEDREDRTDGGGRSGSLPGKATFP